MVATVSEETRRLVNNLDNDRKLTIATAASVHATRWKNVEIGWQDLVKKLATPTRTQELLKEFMKMSKAQQGKIKDVGGFVGGSLAEGRRLAGNVRWRSMLTLDIDNGKPGILDDVKRALTGYTYAVYSTHKHHPKKPRLRVIIPLAENVVMERYEPIARRIAADINIEAMDKTTYQPSRLMFWGSVAKDGQFVFHVEDGDYMDPDEQLARYDDWKDVYSWPHAADEMANVKHLAKKQGDPLEKRGYIGAFNRAYRIEDVIEKWLSDQYEYFKEDRYTYTEGSTAGGLIIYQDGLFCYSHHGTSPTSGMLTNAFDFLRLHLYGDLDYDVATEVPATKRPSYREMIDKLKKDEATIDELKEAWFDASEMFDEFEADYDIADEATSIKTDWLTFSERGTPEINAYLLAQEVMSEVHVFYNEADFLRYDPKKGIWIPEAEGYLKSYIAKNKLKKETRISHVNETIAVIKSLAYSTQEFPEVDLNKLVLANGVYDIKEDFFTSKFDRELHAKVAHPIVYDQHAECPLFDEYLKGLVGEENMDFIFEWFGFCFYRSYQLQKMLFIYGAGGTGKSTLIGILQKLLGNDSYSAVSLSNLMTKDFAAADLVNKTANFDTEAKPEFLKDGAILKQLTGEDTIYANRKYLNPISFHNAAKLTFVMNNLPSMRDFSGGLKRRMIILKINRVLTDKEQKDFSEAAILQELPGIFNKAMQGLRRALKQKSFSISDAVTSEVENWTKNNDVLSLFIEEECDLGEGLMTPVREAYSDYKGYCNISGYTPLNLRNFNTRMEELGYVRKTQRVEGKSTKVWLGIKTNLGEPSEGYIWID